MKRPIIYGVLAVLACAAAISVIIGGALNPSTPADPSATASTAASATPAEAQPPTFQPADLALLTYPAGSEKLAESDCVVGAQQKSVDALRALDGFAYSAHGVLDGVGPIGLEGGWQKGVGTYQYSSGNLSGNADVVGRAGSAFARPPAAISWMDVTGQFNDPETGTDMLSHDQISSVIDIPSFNWEAVIDDDGCLLTGIFAVDMSGAATTPDASPAASAPPTIATADPIGLYAVQLRLGADHLPLAMRMYMPQATGDGGIAASYYDYAIDYDADVSVPTVSADPVPPTADLVRERLVAGGISNPEIVLGPEPFEQDAQLVGWRSGRTLGVNLYANNGESLSVQFAKVPDSLPLGDVFAVPSADGGFFAVVFSPAGAKTLEIADANDQPVATFALNESGVSVIDIGNVSGEIWRLLDGDGSQLLSVADFSSSDPSPEATPDSSFEIPAY